MLTDTREHPSLALAVGGCCSTNASTSLKRSKGKAGEQLEIPVWVAKGRANNQCSRAESAERMQGTRGEGSQI